MLSILKSFFNTGSGSDSPVFVKKIIAGVSQNWWNGFYAGLIGAFCMALAELVRVAFFATEALPQGAAGEYFILALFSSFLAFIPLSILLGVGLAFLSGATPIYDRMDNARDKLFQKNANTDIPALVFALLLAFVVMMRVHGTVTGKMFTGFHNDDLAGRVLNLIEYGLLIFGAVAVVAFQRILKFLFRIPASLLKRLPAWVFVMSWLLPAAVVVVVLAVWLIYRSFDGLGIEERRVIYSACAAMTLIVVLIPLVAILTKAVQRSLRPGRVGHSLRLLRLMIVVTLTIALSFASWMVPKSSGAIAYAVNSSPLIGRLLQLMPNYSDFDNDRYGAFANGVDPDGFDHWRTPVGPEIVGNGIDDNGILGDGEKLLPQPDWYNTRLPQELAEQDFNIVLITFDALRADHLGCYGYKNKTSPNIDKLAAEGAVFERAYSVGTGTMISIPTIFTGHYVSQLQCDNLQKGGIHHEVVAEQDTVQEFLRRNGYYTAGLYNVGYLNIVKQGWNLWKIPKGKMATVKNSTSPETTEEGIDFIKRHNDDKFFLWLHYYDPHDKYVKHSGFKSFGSGKNALYDGEIYYADHYMGRFIKELKKLDRRSVVIISADHGESLGEHGIPFHNLNFYTPIVNVPLIVWYEGMKPRRIKSPVSLIDFYPTVRNLLGEEPDPELPGRSLLTYALEGREDQERPVYHAAQFIQFGMYYSKRGLTRGNYRFFWDVLTGGEELYNVKTDPKESQNLVSALPVKASEMRDTLYRQIESIAVSMPLTDACTYRAPGRKKPEKNPRYVEKHSAAELPQDFEAQRVNFGDQIELAGYRINTNKIGLESSVKIELALKTLQDLENDYSIFVHVQGKKGISKRINLGHLPLRGHAPTSSWKTNRLYIDRFSFDLADVKSRGEMDVFIGFYKKGKRLEIKSGNKNKKSLQDRFRLITLSVN